MADFGIHAIQAGGGRLALCPLPGGNGLLADDMEIILNWGADHIVSLTTEAEMARAGVADLGARLKGAGMDWSHLPIADFGTPDNAFRAAWPALSTRLRACLAQGGAVLVHCRGGCGRSGMVALRVLVELGEDPKLAHNRLKLTRPCAVETENQLIWAIS